MIKLDEDTDKFYMIASGNWQKVVKALNKKSAIKQAFEEITMDPELYKLSKVVIIMNIDQSIKDLSLEESLKFSSVVDIADYIDDRKLARSIKTLFRDV
tara:strand:+ start:61 stop:357 length:297 start_codon:yes stop_codon:yes gene_type:complete